MRVWDYLSQTACPLCRVKAERERQVLFWYNEEFLMDVEMREEVMEKGICPDHLGALVAGENKLGAAITIESLFGPLLKQVEEMGQKPGWRKVRPRLGGAPISAEECLVCQEGRTMVEEKAWDLVSGIWKDPQRREEFEASFGLCVPHAQNLVDASTLLGGERDAFLKYLSEKMKKDLEEGRERLLWFIKKHDYRYQDKPWGDAKDSLAEVLARFGRGERLR